MAFQNNAGGIILDAVLTDAGRKHMAKGKFKVVKFALGDDEVNYEFMSGSVSSHDYKIPDGRLPPVLEAFGSQNANIVYGLLNLPRPDILYIPIFKLNNKLDNSVSQSDDGFIYVSVNRDTTRMLENDLGSPNKVIEQSTYNKNKIIVESGIQVPDAEHTTDLMPTEKNKNSYILNMGLYDAYCLAFADSKIIKNLYVSPRYGKFQNNRNNRLTKKLGPLQKSIKITLPKISDQFYTYRIQQINNNIYQKEGGITGVEYSVFNGPRAGIFAFNVELLPELLNDSTGNPDYRYSLLGSTNNDLFGTGNLYDFIETTIYIQGLSTNSRLQIPLRVIRYVNA
tara:strand:+ start:68 stop:1084 length:1017 start_codon:yes stop_codon:yes gene_type:complete